MITLYAPAGESGQSMLTDPKILIPHMHCFLRHR